MPPLASKLAPAKPSPMYMFLWPELPMDSLPSDLKSLVSNLEIECYKIKRDTFNQQSLSICSKFKNLHNVAHNISHIHMDVQTLEVDGKED
jgi:hypothetical protein